MALSEAAPLVDLEFYTAELSPDYRRLACCLPDGRRIPAALVSTLEDGVTVVALPGEVIPWSTPHLCRLADAESGTEARDGQTVAVAFLILGHPAGLVDADGTEMWTADGRWPLADGLTVPEIPLEVTPDDAVLMDFSTGLPPGDLDVTPQVLDDALAGGLGAGPWHGYLGIAWPPPEPGPEASAAEDHAERNMLEEELRQRFGIGGDAAARPPRGRGRGQTLPKAAVGAPRRAAAPKKPTMVELMQNMSEQLAEMRQTQVQSEDRIVTLEGSRQWPAERPMSAPSGVLPSPLSFGAGHSRQSSVHWEQLASEAGGPPAGVRPSALSHKPAPFAYGGRASPAAPKARQSHSLPETQRVGHGEYPPPPPRPISAMAASAIANFAHFHSLEAETVELEMVQASPSGIAGWAALGSPPTVGATAASTVSTEHGLAGPLAQLAAALLQRKNGSMDAIDGLLSDSGASCSSALPGARGAAALETCRREFLARPRAHTQTVLRNARRALSYGDDDAGDHKKGVMVEFLRTCHFGKSKAVPYMAYAIATAIDLFERDKHDEGMALLMMLMVAVEQSTLDQGRWQLAWLLTHLPEPPWTQLSQVAPPDPLRPFGRLSEPNWSTAAMAYTKDAAALSEIRKRGAKGEGKDKDKDG